MIGARKHKACSGVLLAAVLAAGPMVHAAVCACVRGSKAAPGQDQPVHCAEDTRTSHAGRGQCAPGHAPAQPPTAPRATCGCCVMQNGAPGEPPAVAAVLDAHVQWGIAQPGAGTAADLAIIGAPATPAGLHGRPPPSSRPLYLLNAALVI